MTATVRSDLCPLCGGPNACGLAEGNVKCWCFSVSIAKEALAQVPEEARDKACLCRCCATGKRSPQAIESLLSELHRKR